MSIKILTKSILILLFLLPTISKSQENVKIKMELQLDKSGEILYINTDNLIKIFVSDHNSNEISLRCNNGSIELIDSKKGIWNIRPNKLNDELTKILDLYINSNGKRKKIESFAFKVKELPTKN